MGQTPPEADLIRRVTPPAGPGRLPRTMKAIRTTRGARVRESAEGPGESVRDSSRTKETV